MMIIVDILEDDYNRICDIPLVFNSLTSRIYKAVDCGIKIPENHRGIVDLKEVKWAFDDAILDEARQTGQPRATSEEITKILNAVPVLIPMEDRNDNSKRTERRTVEIS